MPHHVCRLRARTLPGSNRNQPMPRLSSGACTSLRLTTPAAAGTRTIEQPKGSVFRCSGELETTEESSSRGSKKPTRDVGEEMRGPGMRAAEDRDKIIIRFPTKKGIETTFQIRKEAMSVRPAMMVPPPVYELFETLACAHHRGKERERETLRDATKDTAATPKPTPNPNPAKTPTLVPTLVPKKKREPTPEKRKQAGAKQSPKNAPAPAAKPKRALTLPRRPNI